LRATNFKPYTATATGTTAATAATAGGSWLLPRTPRREFTPV